MGIEGFKKLENRDPGGFIKFDEGGTEKYREKL
jgi:hypothetical protein